MYCKGEVNDKLSELGGGEINDILEKLIVVHSKQKRMALIIRIKNSITWLFLD